MIVIAVLLVAAVAVVTSGVILGNEESATFDIFADTRTVSGPVVFAVGVACGLAVALSAWLLLVGSRRSVLRRREFQELREIHAREQAKPAAVTGQQTQAMRAPTEEPDQTVAASGKSEPHPG